jgi:hypothetical protein
MWWDARVQNLVESEAKECICGGVHRTISQDGEKGVDSAELPKNSVEQFHDERPVLWGRLVALEKCVQDVVGKRFSFFPLNQRFVTNGSGI